MIDNEGEPFGALSNPLLYGFRLGYNHIYEYIFNVYFLFYMSNDYFFGLINYFNCLILIYFITDV